MIETKLILEEHASGKLSEKARMGIREEILGHLSGIRRDGMDSLVNFLNESDYFTAPASLRFHAKYEGSLAAHSLLVYREFDFLLKRHGLEVPDESIKISALMHDACKIGAYRKKENGTYERAETLPYGHGELSVYNLNKHIQLTDQEALLIRWHMGEYDNNYTKYGDLFRTKHLELTLLQVADRIMANVHLL